MKISDAKARNDFWLTEGDFIHRHHVEPRVELCRMKKPCLVSQEPPVQGTLRQKIRHSKIKDTCIVEAHELT